MSREDFLFVRAIYLTCSEILSLGLKQSCSDKRHRKTSAAKSPNPIVESVWAPCCNPGIGNTYQNPSHRQSTHLFGLAFAIEPEQRQSCGYVTDTKKDH